MRAVNLLPRATSSRTAGTDRVLVAALAFTVLIAALLAGGFFLERARADTQRQQLAAAQNALDAARAQQPSTKSPAPPRLATPVVLSQQAPWHLTLDAALSTRMAWDVLLSQLEYVVPARLVVTSVSIGGGSGTTATTAVPIAIGGNAYSENDIAAFLSALERVPKLSQVSLVSSTAAAGSSVTTFQIEAQVILPAPATTPAAGTSTTTTTGGQG